VSIDHEWVLERVGEDTRIWRCTVCKRAARRIRGILEDDDKWNEDGPPSTEKFGFCDIDKRIAHLEAELKTLKEKKNPVES